MYLPQSPSVALLLAVMTTIAWGSWANTTKGTKNYPFELFYWDYILGVVLCSFVFAFTLGSHGGSGEPFLTNLAHASTAAIIYALIAGAIFNVANLLLVAAVDIAGLAIAFPIAIGIAVVEGVVLSYLLQPKGDILLLAGGVALALVAVLFDARAYTRLAKGTETEKAPRGLGIKVSVISGILMGAFAPFSARALTEAQPLTPYSLAALFSVGAFLCCFVVNVYFMKKPLRGEPVAFSGFWRASARNHALGLFGGVIWGIGGCLNFIAAGIIGVPISYAIGQSAPLIAAAWGVLIWREFAGADKAAWRALLCMAACYIGAIALIALAYRA